jgi:hypothetical protein
MRLPFMTRTFMTRTFMTRTFLPRTEQSCSGMASTAQTICRHGVCSLPQSFAGLSPWAIPACMAMPSCLEHVFVTTDALCAVAPAQRTYGHILRCKATAASIAGILSQVWRCSSIHAAVWRRGSAGSERGS